VNPYLYLLLARQPQTYAPFVHAPARTRVGNQTLLGGGWL